MGVRPTVTVLLTIFVAVCLDVMGQMLYKSGIGQISAPKGSGLSPLLVMQFAGAAIKNWRVLGGLLGYLVQAIVWWAVLSRVDVSYAFPLTSASYVLLLIAARVWLHEYISPERWLGALAIVVGVYLITRSVALPHG